MSPPRSDLSHRPDGSAPRVSVITIFLDEERFLAESIESVVAQSYCDWELLLCDDGSSDRSTEIARRYAGRYPDRIRYLTHPDRQTRGTGPTRNLGLANAHGKYVAFLDGDDVWLPAKLSHQVARLEEHPDVAMIFGPTIWWSSWSSGDANQDVPSDLCVAATGVVRGRLVLRRMLQRKGESPFTCSVLMRRAAIEAVGGFEDDFTSMEEDRALFSKVLLAYDVIVEPEAHDLYRQHADSLCATHRQDGGDVAPEVLAARYRYLSWLRTYIRNRNAGLRLRWTVLREYWLHRFPLAARLVITAEQRIRYGLGRIVELFFAASRRVLPRTVRVGLWRLLFRTEDTT